MVVILEHNGTYIMGLMLDENGDNLTFNSYKEAEAFAKENCAFEYKIVEL